MSKRFSMGLTIICSTAFLAAAGCADTSATSSDGESSGNYNPGGASGTDGSTGADGYDGTTGSGVPQNAGANYDGTYGPDVPTTPTPPDNSGDKYENVGTNPFVLTSADPYSTFAADVDTASYDIFRRDVGLGILPQADSVRLEEYVNYFHYDYPLPTASGGNSAHMGSTTPSEPFRIDVAAAPSPLDGETTMLRIGIQGMPMEAMERKPVNLVFLIDVSGSMSSASKLPLVKKVLTETLDVLQPTDTVSIVTYAGSTGVALAPTPVSNKAAISSKINSFTSGGSTNGAGGIHLAYQQAESAFVDDGINHVILCSDGDFNVGVSSDQGLVELIEEKRKSGVTLTVLGFGIGNLNDSMMEAITNAGNGTYGVISDEDHAIDYVHKRMLSSLYFIAKDMKIQVVFNPDKVLAYRLLGYENRDIADEDFVDDTVDAGEVGAGHTVTALYELVMSGESVPMADSLPPSDEASALLGEEMSVMPEELVRVAVRYKTPGASEADAALEVSQGLTATEVAGSLAAADEDFRWAAAVAALAEVVKGSPYVTDQTLTTAGSIITAYTGLDADKAELKAYFQAFVELQATSK